MAKDPRVVYVGGFGRSGSTLLDRILDETDRVVGVGETIYLWRRGLVENQLCGCGEPFLECPFWEEVFDRGWGGFSEELGREMDELRTFVDRVIRLPRLYAGRDGTDYADGVDRYLENLETLYRTVAEVAGADVVVDSSKIPSTPYLVRREGEVPMTTVHLVRDPRAVAHAWKSRSKRRPEIHWEERYMPTATPAESARAWIVNNLFMEPHRWTGDSHLRMRYEDLAREPRREVRRVLEAADHDAPLPLDGDDVTFTGNHNAAGNPLRFKDGTITVRLDEKWKRNMSRRDKWVVTAHVGPGLLRYGYPLRPP